MREDALRGRYAPSPTGDLHLGNASTALLAWLSVRSQRGEFVMRIEDLDQQRVRPGIVDRILLDLTWLGLDWDEGTDRGGPYAPYSQWERRELYTSAWERLVEEGRLYPCFCTRRDVVSASSAPQAPGDEVRYPRTCRDLPIEEARKKIGKGTAPSWRFRVPEGERAEFVDRVRGYQGLDPEVTGDFVVRRADGVAAYQLAVVVDDAAMKITEVVRGDDLIRSTTRQILLYRALGHSPPTFAHVPLILGTDGVRLSKRHRGTSIAEIRGRGVAAEEVVGRLAHLLGLKESAEPIAARELLDGFSFDRLRKAPAGIALDAEVWAGREA